jgi:wyosine [tRNA(Phe)-imidazoG37] synthetase (radical SAM superfamily)
MAVIYGPVPSWRLGRSLGIDLLSTKVKTCSFDCVYCQLGKTINYLIERREFVPISRLLSELKSLKNIDADYATFSGVGEPTLASNLGQAIKLVKTTLGLPVAVLTNSSLMTREDVRKELAQADVVVAKIDASNDKLFHAINRPAIGCTLNEIIRGIRNFRSEFNGKLALQMMFIGANKGYAPEMAKIAEQISPDEVELNTPLRPCAVKSLEPEDIKSIRHAFSKVKNVLTVFEASRPEVAALNPEETHRRRPDTPPHVQLGK